MGSYRHLDHNNCNNNNNGNHKNQGENGKSNLSFNSIESREIQEADDEWDRIFAALAEQEERFAESNQPSVPHVASSSGLVPGVGGGARIGVEFSPSTPPPPVAASSTGVPPHSSIAHPPPSPPAYSSMTTFPNSASNHHRQHQHHDHNQYYHGSASRIPTAFTAHTAATVSAGATIQINALKQQLEASNRDYQRQSLMLSNLMEESTRVKTEWQREVDDWKFKYLKLEEKLKFAEREASEAIQLAQIQRTMATDAAKYTNNNTNYTNKNTNNVGYSSAAIVTASAAASVPGSSWEGDLDHLEWELSMRPRKPKKRRVSLPQDPKISARHLTRNGSQSPVAQQQEQEQQQEQQKQKLQQGEEQLLALDNDGIDDLQAHRQDSVRRRSSNSSMEIQKTYTYPQIEKNDDDHDNGDGHDDDQADDVLAQDMTTEQDQNSLIPCVGLDDRDIHKVLEYVRPMHIEFLCAEKIAYLLDHIHDPQLRNQLCIEYDVAKSGHLLKMIATLGKCFTTMEKESVKRVAFSLIEILCGSLDRKSVEMKQPEESLLISLKLWGFSLSHIEVYGMDAINIQLKFVKIGIATVREFYAVSWKCLLDFLSNEKAKKNALRAIYDIVALETKETIENHRVFWIQAIEELSRIVGDDNNHGNRWLALRALSFLSDGSRLGPQVILEENTAIVGRVALLFIQECYKYGVLKDSRSREDEQEANNEGVLIQKHDNLIELIIFLQYLLRHCQSTHLELLMPIRHPLIMCHCMLQRANLSIKRLDRSSILSLFVANLEETLQERMGWPKRSEEGFLLNIV